MKANRRLAKRRPKHKRYEARALGNGMEQATPAAVIEALSRLPTDLGWESVADLIVPMFVRRRPFPFETGTPVRVVLPPGILTGFGVDIGPALLHVGEDTLGRWPVTRDQLVDRALDNLAALTRRARPRDLVNESLDGIPVRILQTGAGWAATLVLLRSELIRIFGSGTQRLIAPMRDLLISLPSWVEDDVVAWLAEEFAAMDPNALALESFVIADGDVSCVPLQPVVEARA
jgi:hypothetical protein